MPSLAPNSISGIEPIWKKKIFFSFKESLFSKAKPYLVVNFGKKFYFSWKGK